MSVTRTLVSQVVVLRFYLPGHPLPWTLSSKFSISRFRYSVLYLQYSSYLDVHYRRFRCPDFSYRSYRFLDIIFWVSVPCASAGLYFQGIRRPGLGFSDTVTWASVTQGSITRSSVTRKYVNPADIFQASVTELSLSRFL